ncbi:hypothetical protein KAR91_81270 [Candidatus Pacearchaeota archaeon]|nr:hypothetical protein [Candidatus Pacearchaeota archaeon]
MRLLYYLSEAAWFKILVIGSPILLFSAGVVEGQVIKLFWPVSTASLIICILMAYISCIRPNKEAKCKE